MDQTHLTSSATPVKPRDIKLHMLQGKLLLERLRRQNGGAKAACAARIINDIDCLVRAVDGLDCAEEVRS